MMSSLPQLTGVRCQKLTVAGMQKSLKIISEVQFWRQWWDRQKVTAA